MKRPGMQERASLVLHIPHSSARIPDDIRATLLLDDAALAAELLRLTDHYTDELFCGQLPGAAEVVYPFSRLVADPERFEDDAREPAAVHGMGVIYTHGSRGQRLRNAPDAAQRGAVLARHYHPHHRRLATAVEECLEGFDHCLLIDCHSFPRDALPIERSGARPDICIGTDAFHTPATLRDAAVACFLAQGFTVMVDEPFAGALVPAPWYGLDRRVEALMIEVGRWLYMDEESGMRNERFHAFRDTLGRCVTAIASRSRPQEYCRQRRAP